MQSVFLKKIPLMCLIQIHCSSGYFWPEHFFFLLKRTNSAKMNLQLFLFSADCLLEKGKNSLQSSLSPPPSRVCTPSLSQGCSHTLSHACACSRSLSHTQTQKNDLYHLQVIHTYIHFYCTHTYIHFVRIDFV